MTEILKTVAMNLLLLVCIASLGVVLVVLVRSGYRLFKGAKKRKEGRAGGMPETPSLIRMIAGLGDDAEEEFKPYSDSARVWVLHPDIEVRREARRYDLKTPEPSAVSNDLEDDAKEQQAVKPAVAVISFDETEKGRPERHFGAIVDAIIYNFEKGLISRAVVVMNSPGGSVTLYGYLYTQVERLRNAGIHVTGCIDQNGASGGYLAVLPCDEINAGPFANVGSVGVFAAFLNYHELLERIGVKFKVWRSAEGKNPVTPFGPISENDEKFMQGKIDSTQRLFLETLRKWRPNANVEKVKSGDCWSAKESIEAKLGLVDYIRSSEEVLYGFGLEEDVVYFGHRKSRMVSLFSDVAARAIVQVVEELAPNVARLH